MSVAPVAPDVSVVVVNYNGKQHLTRCLDAVFAQQGVRFEVVVVDNASTDGSRELIRDGYPAARLVSCERNLGFAGGNNRGVAQARAPLVALLNNDTAAAPDWLAQLCSRIDPQRGVALVTSRIVYMHDPRVLDSAGDGVTRAGGAYKRGHGAAAADYLITREVFGACGAACLVTRTAFDSVSGFDEDFFLSHEDVDLSYRLRLRGYRCVYEPAAVVRHVGSASLGRTSSAAVYFGQRNLEWLYFKNTPTSLLWWTLPQHLLYVLAAGVHFARVGQLAAFCRGKWAALIGMRQLLHKRREVQRARTVSSRAIWQQLDRGWLRRKLREKQFDRALATPR